MLLNTHEKPIEKDPSGTARRERGMLWWFVVAIVAAVTLLPIVRMGCIVANTGVNTLTGTDYFVTGYVPLIGHMVDGTYAWKHLLHDTFIWGTHSIAAPMVLRLILVKLTHWNMYGELWASIALSGIKLGLLYAAFTRVINDNAKSRARVLLLPVLSALLFSITQLNNFTWGDSGLNIGLGGVGVALAVWGLARFADRWAGIGVMIAGSMLATFSGGVGPSMWGIALVGMALLGYRQWKQYVVWAVASAVVALPFLLYIDPSLSPEASNHEVNVFNLSLFVKGLGLPFSDDLSSDGGFWPGIIGLVLLLVIGALLVKRRDRATVKAAAPAVMFMLYGLINIYVISAFRPQLEPWYPMMFMAVWVGIVGMVYVLWEDRRNGRARIGIAVTTLIVMSVLYASSNAQYTNKLAYVSVRTPVAASCLREYRTLISYCNEHLSVPTKYQIDLAPQARVLERLRLSVFAPRQTWMLQGEYGMRTVEVAGVDGLAGAQWSIDRREKGGRWDDYHHRNLVLSSGARLTWSIALPKQLASAELETAVALPDSANSDTNAKRNLRIGVEVDQRPVVWKRTIRLGASSKDWRPIDIDIKKYAGQKIRIVFESDQAAVLRSPRVELDGVNSHKGMPEPNLTSAKLTDNDLEFDVKDALRYSSMTVESPVANTWLATRYSSIEVKQAFSQCVGDISGVVIRMSVSPSGLKRDLRVEMSRSRSSAVASATVRVFGDGKMHTYFLDAKSFPMAARDSITLLRFRPLIGARTRLKTQLTIESVGVKLTQGSHAC